jgi:hypothetical protein
MAKKYDRTLSQQVYEIDPEDGGDVVLVRPKFDSDEGYFTLEVTRKKDGQEIGLGRFLEPRDLPWPEIYNVDDLQAALEQIFGDTNDDLTQFELEVAEWREAVSIETLRPRQRREAYSILEKVYTELIEATVHDNAVESGDDLYMRFGNVVLRISPRLILED